MCEVTKTLKLCTCHTDVAQLRNYWLYNRFIKDKENLIIGEACMPVDLVYPLSVNNKKRITRMLNAGDCFDFDIEPQEKDQLHLYFTTGLQNEDKQEIGYSFEFYKSKWRSITTDSLMMFWHHETFLDGEVRNGLNRNIESRDLKEKLA